MATVLVKYPLDSASSTDSLTSTGDEKVPEVKVRVDDGLPPLGVPRNEKRFWWQRMTSYDPNAIATLPSVYDHAESAALYKPRDDWENNSRFDPLVRPFSFNGSLD